MRQFAFSTVAGLAWAACTALSVLHETRAAEATKANLDPKEAQRALFDRINIAEAWKVTKGDPQVLIGVIDNEFDFFKPDLKVQLIQGY